jgi:hypothetical protein
MNHARMEALIEIKERLIRDVLTPRDPESAMMTAESPWPATPQRLPTALKAARCRSFAEERLSWIRDHLNAAPFLRDAVFSPLGMRATSRGSATWWEAKIPLLRWFRHPHERDRHRDRLIRRGGKVRPLQVHPLIGAK